jgi:phospholipase A1
MQYYRRSTHCRRSLNPMSRLRALLLLTALTGSTGAAAEAAELPPPFTPYEEAGGLEPPALRPAEALSVHEPMYFLLGDGSQFTARFQLSFKYRIFDERGWLTQRLPPLSGLYFGYTQTSLWDLGEESRPFADTSYRPSVFWLYDSGRRGLLPTVVRAGYEHESNGRGEFSSRSVDTLFVQPHWETSIGSRKLSFAPKLYVYLEDEDNPDIEDYRGYADWIVRYGRDDGWLWRGQIRQGAGGHSTVQLDVSYPLREPLFARSGAFFHVQLLHGYGETLLNYDERVDLRLWLGVSVVR